MTEKRQFIRFDIALKAAYIVQKKPKIEKFSSTKDISAQGMQLLTGEKLESGDRIDLKLFIPEALNPIHLKGVIAWSKDLPVGTAGYTHSAGISFEKIEEDNKNTFLKFLCGLMYVGGKEE
jgi:c-di-GMP-binding flagellar brake protein YcgR